MANIVYPTISEARTRSAMLMDAARKPGNSDGDGKSYVTALLFSVLANPKTGEGALVVPDSMTGLLTTGERATARSPLSVDFVPDES